MSIDAQKLIEKGIKYQDWELIEEGKALLEAQNGGKAPTDIVLPTVEETPAAKSEDEVLKRGEELKKQHENGEFGFDIRGSDGSRKRGEGGTYMRSEPIDTSKVSAFNMFEDTLEEAVADTKAAQAAANDGKTLYTGRGRTQRKPPVELVKTNCIECNKEFTVAPQHIRRVDGESRFVCEKCIIGKGRPSYNRM